MFVVGVLGERQADCGGAVFVEVGKVVGPEWGNSEAVSGHAERGFADAIKRPFDIPGGDEAGGMVFPSLF